MDAREQARALVGEMLDSALGEAKKGKGRKGSSLADEGGEEARGRLIGWLIKRGVIKRRGKPGGSAPAKGGPKLKRKHYNKPNMHPQYGRPEKVKGWKRTRAAED